MQPEPPEGKLKKKLKYFKHLKKYLEICHNPYRQVQAESSEYIAGRGGGWPAAGR